MANVSVETESDAEPALVGQGAGMKIPEITNEGFSAQGRERSQTLPRSGKERAWDPAQFSDDLAADFATPLITFEAEGVDSRFGTTTSVYNNIQTNINLDAHRCSKFLPGFQ